MGSVRNMRVALHTEGGGGIKNEKKSSLSLDNGQSVWHVHCVTDFLFTGKKIQTSHCGVARTSCHGMIQSRRIGPDCDG